MYIGRIDMAHSFYKFYTFAKSIQEKVQDFISHQETNNSLLFSNGKRKFIAFPKWETIVHCFSQMGKEISLFFSKGKRQLILVFLDRKRPKTLGVALRMMYTVLCVNQVNSLCKSVLLRGIHWSFNPPEQNMFTKSIPITQLYCTLKYINAGGKCFKLVR